MSDRSQAGWALSSMACPRTFIACTTIILMLIPGLTSAAADSYGDARLDLELEPTDPSLEPRVYSDGWDVSSISCSGQYSSHTETNTEESGWNFLVWKKSSVSTTSSTTIDFSYSCGGPITMDVMGSGGVHRKVGVLGKASQAIGIPGMGTLPAIEQEVEVGEGCEYLVEGCSFTLAVSGNAGQFKVGTTSFPDEWCGTMEDLTLFNRLNTEQEAGHKELRDFPGYDPLIENSLVIDGDDIGCVGIDWEEVDPDELEIPSFSDILGEAESRR